MQVTLDVEAVRARFSALRRPYAFFDGPAGTQVPDEVIDAIAGYLRNSNANVGGQFETSRRTGELVESAHETAGRFLGCSADEAIFGPSMTNLNFMLTRTVGRELREGDEIVTTRLDHDANVAPWLELAHDLGLVVRFADYDLSDVEKQLSDRTRVVAFPWASNALGTLVDAARICELAHEAGALAWVDAVHYAPHGPIDVAEIGADVLLCSPYKFYGPHLGLAFARRELLDRWRPYKVRPAPGYETGTAQHELLAGFVAAVAYIESVGLEAIVAHERELGERFLAGLPEGVTLYGRQTMDGRVPTFAINAGRPDADGSCRAPWRARHLRLGRELLRARGDEAPRPAGRRSPHRDRPLQHGRGGRPPARRAQEARRTAGVNSKLRRVSAEERA